VNNKEVVLSKKRGRRKGRQKFAHEVRQPIQAITNVQKEFLRALQEYDVVVFSAPAGVGKSFTTMSEVTDWLKRGKVDKITLTRPSIPMGRSIGLLPNDMRSKFEPYLMPLLEVWWERYGKNHYENCLSNGSLELLPAEYIRGRSVEGVFVCDEGQSFEPDEIYTLITRMQEGSKLIILGDPTQSDIKGENAITWLSEFVNRNVDLKSFIKIIEASSDDIVRSGVCKAMVKAKERYGVN